ncbi:MAG: glycosyltransferase [Nitrospirota bacterium]
MVPALLAPAESRSVEPGRSDRRARANGLLGPARVLHLIDALEPGGAERVLAEIVAGLDRAHYRPRVLCLVKRGAVADELRRAGVPVDCFEFDGAHRWRELIRLARWFRQHEVNLLHTHGYSAGVLGRVAGLLARIPVIVAHLHTTDWGWRRRQRWIERALAFATSRIICCSHAVAGFAQRGLGLPLGKLSVIYNGVALDRFQPAHRDEGLAVRRRFGLAAGDPVIGIIGALSAHKGHDVALRALALVREQLAPKQLNIRLLLVGDGPERPRLQKLAQELSLLPAVIFAGRQPDVAPLIAACDLICLPSVTREGLGVAVLEAMAMARPVVASDLEGIPEAVVDGETGRLVPPRRPGELARALLELLVDDKRRSAMGEAGRRRAERLFGAHLMIGRVTELYDELRERRRRWFSWSVIRRRATVLYTTCRGSLAGGGQQSLIHLLGHLDRRHFRPVVLCPKRGEVSEWLEASGIEAVIAPLPRAAFRTAIPMVRNLLRLIGLLRVRRVDLIHTDSPRETLYAGLAARLCRLRRVPLLWHVRASNGEWADRWLVGLSSRLILVADALRTRFRMTMPTDQMNRLVVIHNGVELSRPAGSTHHRRALEKELGITSQTIVMAAVGRVEPLKGADTLVDALGQFRRQWDYRLLFLGTIDPAYQARLSVKARALDVADRIVFMGHRAPIEPWIQAVDFLVHPSLFEAFPRVILEAMAAAKPVIATMVGGIAEAVLDGETGVLVPGGSAGALAQAMEHLMRDPLLRERMGRAGRQRAEHYFGAAEHARRVEAQYRVLLGGDA